MTVGICTRYSYHEAAFAALRLADCAVEQGLETSLFTMSSTRVAIDQHWDRKVILMTDMRFTAWAQSLDHILWTNIPHPQQIKWAKSQGKKTSALILWHELSEEHLQALNLLDHLICPSRACHELLRFHGFKNAFCIPWDTGLPQYRKPLNYAPVHPKLLLPLWDGNPRRTEMTALAVAARALARNPDATLTLGYNSSSMCSKGKRQIRAMSKQFGNRFTAKKSVSARDRYILYQQHDLTLWPTHYESTCATGLNSIEMGTPIIGFSFRPTDEILTVNNSIPIVCQESVNDLGAPMAIPDYELFDEFLHCLLKDMEFLRQLQHTTPEGSISRRSLFTQGFARILF